MPVRKRRKRKPAAARKTRRRRVAVTGRRRRRSPSRSASPMATRRRRRRRSSSTFAARRRTTVPRAASRSGRRRRRSGASSSGMGLTFKSLMSSQVLTGVAATAAGATFAGFATDKLAARITALNSPLGRIGAQAAVSVAGGMALSKFGQRRFGVAFAMGGLAVAALSLVGYVRSRAAAPALKGYMGESDGGNTPQLPGNSAAFAGQPGVRIRAVG